MLDSELKKEIKEYGVSMRRHFHQNPELGGQEFETAKRIEAELDLLGIEHERVGDTNVISTIQGKRDGKIIGLRADIDALPVQEESGVAYQSKIPGIMHACGHDGHTAALLSAAKILTARKDEIAGTVKLLFQSAEELGLGAKAIVGSGEIDNLDGLLGIHIWNDVDSGKLYIGSGEQMASPVEFRISLEGKGSWFGVTSGNGYHCPTGITDYELTIPCQHGI